MEMWFGTEMDCGCCGGDGGPGCGERQEREKPTGEIKKRTLPKSHKLGKGNGLIFKSFCNQRGSKIGVLKVREFGWHRSLRTLPYSWRKGRQADWGQMA